MGFYKEECIPILNKIADDVKRETLNTNKMPVKSFIRIVTRTRASKKDVDDIIYYFRSIGFIEQRGNTIYRLSEPVKQQGKPKSRPGRYKKLTMDEIVWLQKNYRPRENTIRGLAETINKRRKDESVSFMAVFRALSSN